MNLLELEKKLIAAARKDAPDDRVPYAFEQRIMAQLASLPEPDFWALWARALWRSASLCLAVMVLLSAISFFVPAPAASGSTDLAQDLETTVLAATDPEPSTDATW